MRALILAIAALGLAACQPTTPGPSPVAYVAPTTVDNALVRGTQALIASENLYTVVAANAARGIRYGVIPSSQHATIRELNRKITAGLDAGVAAQSGAEKLRQAGIVNALVKNLRSLIPGG